MRLPSGQIGSKSLRLACAGLQATAGPAFPISMLSLSQCMGLGQCGLTHGRDVPKSCLPALLCPQ